MKFVGVLLCALILAGCAELRQLKDFAIADARLAQQWAAEDGDKLAEMCYAALIDVASTLNIPEREAIGALSEEYLVRHVRKTIDGVESSPELEKLRIGCGPLLLEKRDFAIKLGIKFLK